MRVGHRHVNHNQLQLFNVNVAAEIGEQCKLLPSIQVYEYKRLEYAIPVLELLMVMQCHY